MITVQDALQRLSDAVDSGTLAEVCGQHNIEFVSLFGSAVTSQSPGDIDLAIGFTPGAERDFLGAVNALGALIPGDHLDIMDFDRADPVAKRAATTSHRVIYEAHPAASTEREIRAFMEFEDTRWLRRLQQEALMNWSLP